MATGSASGMTCVRLRFGALLTMLLLAECLAGGCFGGNSNVPAPDDLTAVTQDLTVSAATGAISGEVVQQNGVAVEAASISLTHPDYEESVSVTTDTQGIFYVGNLPEGTYQATVSVVGAQGTTATIIVVSGVIRAVTIVLPTNIVTS